MGEASDCGPRRPTLAVCIATYCRPRGLFALLGALDVQEFSDDPPNLRVIVVDNDAHESARDVCERARGWLRHELDYVTEPRKGIPHARNAALARALPDACWLAFVDDDEVPQRGWLDALLTVQRASGADVVAGPVLPRFARQPPGWVREGGFFAPPRHRTGASRPTAFTNNALVCADALAHPSARFDESFVPMGEDVELFERLVRAGRRVVWADEAIVYDVVPPARTTPRWLLRRGFRGGTTRTHLDRVHRVHGVPRILLLGASCILKGTLRAAHGVRRGRASRIAGLQIVAYGLGRWAGLAGVR